ncbi:hypothetical protein HY837_04210 [archaeon]|nr:hypothetical protein [archaeon]
MKFIFPITQAGRRIRDIEKAIKDEKYLTAEELLSAFKGEIDTGKIYVHDHTIRWNKLNELNERERRKTKIRQAIEKYDFPEAKKNLDELIDQKLISKQEAEELDAKKIYPISEEGLLAAIRHSEKYERRFFSEKFVEVYPSNKEKRKVIEDLIVERFSDLSNAPEQNASSDDLYETIHDVNNLLQKYAGENIDLSKVVNVDELSGRINEYLKNLKQKRDTKGNLAVGSIVRFVKNEERAWGNQNWGYIHEREGKVPKGSVGKLIKKDGWQYLVEFEEIEVGAWKDSLWESMRKCISEGKNNVVIFEKTELQPIEPANEIDKNHVRLELERMKELFQESYTKTQAEPAKKRHNPEVIG